jgi:predicted patatin/cPLA2 family phospholipase
MKITNVRYELDEITQSGGRMLCPTEYQSLAISEVLTAKEREELQSFFIMKNMLQELKMEATEAIKDLAKQVLKEILQPEQVLKKPTKKEQFELDIKRKSEERMLSLIKKHSKKK